MIGIYKITSPSGKIYIGQTRNYYKRLISYKGLHCKKQRRLYNSFLKYGYVNHTFEFIESCEIEQLNIRERYYQDLYNVISEKGLNCVLVEIDNKSRIISESTRKKYSENAKNRKYSIETRMKQSFSAKNKPKISEETRLKLSDNSHTRKKVICTKTLKIWNSIKLCSDDLNINYDSLMRKLRGVNFNNTNLIYLEHLNLTDINEPLSEETKLKIKINLIDYNSSEKAKSNVVKSRKGRKMSEESKIKSSIAKKSGNNPQAKKVICIKTGKIWDCIKDCAIELNIKPQTLCRNLNGTYENKTTIRYYINGQ